MLAIVENFQGTPVPIARMSSQRVMLAYAEEFRSEVLRHARMPGFIIPTLLFPSMFYSIFYLLLASQHDQSSAIYWLTDYATFGAMAPGLYAFGISVAHERENGFLTFKRALPVPDFGYLAAKLSLSMLVTVASVLILMTLARVTGNQIPPALGAIRLLAVEALGSLPFCAAGLLIGSLVRGQSATGVVNIIYMPLAFLSGLMVPLEVLPRGVQVIAAALPGHHLLALALAAVGSRPTNGFTHVAFLVLFGAIAAGVAQWRLKARG